MAQKLLASILLFAFLGQTFNQGWYYLDYAVRQKEYVKRCVNKSRPKLHCNGKCQLMKKIEEQEKKERQQSPEMKLAGKTEVLSSRSSFLLSVPALLSIDQIHYTNINSGSPVDRPSAHFHPPNA